MSDGTEAPTWDNNAPKQSATANEGSAWVPSGTDAWKAVTGQGSPSTTTHGASGMNMLSSVASPAVAVQNTVTNVGKIDSLTDWDGYSNLITGLAGDITGIQGAAENFWSMVEGITDPKFDPVQWLAGSLIDFLIQVFQPLEDLVGMVSGNETRMRTSASMWNTVSAGAPQVADYVKSMSDDNLSDWVGTDGDAARMRIGEASEAIRGMGFIAVGLEGILGCMADLAKALRQDIVDLLAKGVSWALTRLLPQVAAAVATFGATIATAIADAVYKVASLVMRAISRIKQASEIFAKAAKVIGTINEVLTKIKPVLEFLKNYKQGINAVAGTVDQIGA
ncbi:hypothetical protein [Glycomyces arizonensis]|uniref:hypothetical protein n=1 Tax=Glycomyces arizonensis TaxID=256035 RepID=UPI0004052B54|nr:hypothetical protein [Glycomyces arizonensis]